MRTIPYIETGSKQRDAIMKIKVSLSSDLKATIVALITFTFMAIYSMAINSAMYSQLTIIEVALYVDYLPVIFLSVYMFVIIIISSK